MRAESDIRFTVTPNMHVAWPFEPLNVANNAWAGGKAAPLIVGEPRDCFCHNKTTKNVVVEFRAWRNERFPFVEVAATGYVQRASG